MKIVFEKDSEQIKSPSRAYDTDSGFDLYSPYEFTLKANERATISTGVKFQIKTPLVIRMLKFVGAPLEVEAQIRPKSGRSKAGYEVSLGTIDWSYTGATGITIHNFTNKKIKFSKDEKLAQIVFSLVFTGKRFNLQSGKVNQNTQRGSKGFGSSGVK